MTSDSRETIAMPASPGDSTSDAELARRWLGDARVDWVLGELAAGRHPGPLADLLLERQMIDEVQHRQLASMPPVRLLGDFEVLKALGSGAMGEVWHARQLATGKLAAIKTITASHQIDTDFIQRFERETSILTFVRHRHIVGALARGVVDGRPWVAMEYIPGPTLADLLAEHGPLPEAVALRFIIQVATGLDHAYSTAQLIHRDIKPANLIIDRSGRPPARKSVFAPEDAATIIDFGLSKPIQATEDVTIAGIIMGTPSYIAPEQIRSVPDLDHRADQYALGATLFHLLTGRTPYHGPSPMEVIVAHLQAPVPDPRLLVPGISARTAQLVMTMMAKERSQRYPLWQDVIAAGSSILKEVSPVTGSIPGTRPASQRTVAPAQPSVPRPVYPAPQSAPVKPGTGPLPAPASSAKPAVKSTYRWTPPQKKGAGGPAQPPVKVPEVAMPPRGDEALAALATDRILNRPGSAASGTYEPVSEVMPHKSAFSIREWIALGCAILAAGGLVAVGIMLRAPG